MKRVSMTDKGNKAFYDMKWEEVGYFAEEELVRRIAGAVLSGSSVNSKVLDIGCGDGRFINYLSRAGLESVGIEFSIEALKKAKERNLSVCLADGHFLPFRDETFDIITCIEVLEHIFNYADVLAEMKRVCKKQGKMILVVPNFMRLVNRYLMVVGLYPDMPEHIHHFTFTSFKQTLEQNGLKIEDLSGDFVYVPRTRLHIPWKTFRVDKIIHKLCPNLSHHIIAVCRK